MITLGLTGSIGMGKSTTASMFAEAGVPVWDADATVHRLYGPGAKGSRAIAAIVPGVVDPEKGVNRSALRSAILETPDLLAKIEAAVHPLVAEDRDGFLQQHRDRGATVVLCDIPLLFETGADQWLDKIVVVTAPAEVQRTRVLARPGMTEAAFEAILAKQLPDEEKSRRADFLVDSSRGMAEARRQVGAILEALHA